MQRMLRFIIIISFSIWMMQNTVFATDLELPFQLELPLQKEELDFTELQEFLDQELPEDSVTFSELMEELMSGNSNSVFITLLKGLKDRLVHEAKANGGLMKNLILIGIFTAIFTTISSAFGNQTISETGYFMNYMLIITLLLSSYQILAGIVNQVLTLLMDFMKVLLPVYMVSLGLQVGQNGALGYYQMALVVISAVEFFCIHVLVPGVGIYMVLHMINYLSKEDFISKAGEFVKKGMNYSLNALFAVVTGMNVVQGMLLPVNGTIRRQAASSLLGLVSGGMANQMTNLAYGTISAIRNVIGVFGVCVIIMIVMIPIVKMLVFIFGYHMVMVILQPVSDKRIIKSTEGMVEGANLLLKCVFLSSFMMILTVAIVCITVQG